MEHPSKRQRIGDTAPLERKRRHAEMARRAVTTVSELDIVDATIFVSVESNAAGVPTTTITLPHTLLSHVSSQTIVSVPTAPSVPVVPVVAPEPSSAPIPPASVPTPAVPYVSSPGSQPTPLPAILTLPSLPTTPPTLIPPYAFPSALPTDPATILPVVPGLIGDSTRTRPPTAASDIPFIPVFPPAFNSTQNSITPSSTGASSLLAGPLLTSSTSSDMSSTPSSGLFSSTTSSSLSSFQTSTSSTPTEAAGGGVSDAVGHTSATGKAKSSTTGAPAAPSTSTPIVAGAVVGSVGGITILLLLIVMGLRWHRYRRRSLRYPSNTDSATNLHAGAGSAGAAMAQRRSFLPAGFINRFSHNNRSSSPTLPEDRGFQKIAGRKVPSQFSPGHDGPMVRDFQNDSNVRVGSALSRDFAISGERPPARVNSQASETSVYSEGRGNYPGGALSSVIPLYHASSNPPSADYFRGGAHNNETLMPSPARTPQFHAPEADDAFSITAAPSPYYPGSSSPPQERRPRKPVPPSFGQSNPQ